MTVKIDKTQQGIYLIHNFILSIYNEYEWNILCVANNNNNTTNIFGLGWVAMFAMHGENPLLYTKVTKKPDSRFETPQRFMTTGFETGYKPVLFIKNPFFFGFLCSVNDIHFWFKNHSTLPHTF